MYTRSEKSASRFPLSLENLSLDEIIIVVETNNEIMDLIRCIFRRTCVILFLL